MEQARLCHVAPATLETWDLSRCAAGRFGLGCAGPGRSDMLSSEAVGVCGATPAADFSAKMSVLNSRSIAKKSFILNDLFFSEG